MKKFSKKLGLFCALAVSVMTVFSTATIEVKAANPVEEEGIIPCSTNLTWVYATIDGVEYMRLYNHSTGQWLTDWIPVNP